MVDATGMDGRRLTMRQEARRLRAQPGRNFWARFIAIALLVAGAVDAASTEIALATGYAFEANPLVRALQQSLGGWWLVAKMAAHVALSAAVLWYPNRPTLFAMAGVALLTSAVAINNIMIYMHILRLT